MAKQRHDQAWVCYAGSILGLWSCEQLESQVLLFGQTARRPEKYGQGCTESQLIREAL